MVGHRKSLTLTVYVPPVTYTVSVLYGLALR